jgi:hypothetical protein
LSAKQALILLHDDPVALARRRLQALAVQNRHLASMIPNQAVLLKRPEHVGDTGTAHTEHLRQEFMSDRKLVGCHSVMGHQQPATTALLHGVQAVAGYSLRNLKKEDAVVKEQQAARTRPAATGPRAGFQALRHAIGSSPSAAFGPVRVQWTI